MLESRSAAVVVAEIGELGMNDIDQWTHWMRTANNSAETIEQRTYHVARLIRELRGDPWSYSAEDLISWLGSHDWLPNTTRAYRASMRSFYRWGQGMGRRPDNPALLIPTVNVPRGLPRPTPELIYKAALMYADERVRLMIHLAAVCGLRRGEISRVRREHVVEDLLGWSLYVKGKGGHEAWVPLPDELAHELRRCDPGWIFPSSARPGPLTPAHVGKLVSRALPDRWTCHTLRHRCGTVAYAAQKDLRAVQELLRHAKPETTAIYTQAPAQSIRDAMLAAAAAA